MGVKGAIIHLIAAYFKILKLSSSVFAFFQLHSIPAHITRTRPRASISYCEISQILKEARSLPSVAPRA